MRIPVAGDDAVAGVAGQGAGAQVPGAERKRPARAAGEHDQIDGTRFCLQPGNRPGIGPRPRRLPVRVVRGSRPGALHQLLREPRLRRNVGPLAELPEAETQQAGHDQRPRPATLPAHETPSFAAST